MDFNDILKLRSAPTELKNDMIKALSDMLRMSIGRSTNIFNYFKTRGYDEREILHVACAISGRYLVFISPSQLHSSYTEDKLEDAKHVGRSLSDWKYPSHITDMETGEIVWASFRNPNLPVKTETK